ncbi:pirin family protein [Corynebacterium sp.]|uniref:pirin family protein n=1 Tax=Corynebacterium sp. TaxID=1720 RepID=UPI002A90E0D4|nr:pirin family protein [Corynebacterium sp.]MDY5785339.1 pirin family protein [Corynebacterium sp.]
MSNTEAHPDELVLGDGGCAQPESDCPGADVEIITAREVPLGGPRAMTVHRTLPQRQRSMIGAWCFADHYGPDDVSVTGGMDVAPHPHTGLQTVSWLFEGEIQHIDSGGNRGLVRPGEVNLMTSGGGICHSETSTAHTTALHGVQLWLALPEGARTDAPRAFEHYAPTPFRLTGLTPPRSAGQARVFIGTMFGQTSPVTTYTPLLGAELKVAPGQEFVMQVNPEFEHGLLVDAAGLQLEGVDIPARAIGYTGVGEKTLTVKNTTDAEIYAILLGGEPFGEEILMWWNFVARDYNEIEQYRREWQARGERFGRVEGYVGHGGPDRNAEGQSWLPAPELPNARIRPRKNPEPVARPSQERG